MQNIDIDQAKQHLPELIEQAARGEEVVITKGGQPVAKIIPVTKEKRPRQFGSARGLMKISGDFNEPLDDVKEYR